jgi:hypothetical protein
MKQALVALMVLIGVGYLVKPLRAQTFMNGQDASGVIGQTSFDRDGDAAVKSSSDVGRVRNKKACDGQDRTTMILPACYCTTRRCRRSAYLKLKRIAKR